MKKKRLLFVLGSLLVFILLFMIPYWTLPDGSYCQLENAPERSIRSFYEADYGPEQLDSLMQRFGKNKELPEGYELEALLALSFYPELEEVRLRFVIGSHVLAPASSRPTVLSSFRRPENRQYLVFLDTESELDIMDKILIGQMPFNARIGLIAHELGHSADYMRRNTWGMMQVLVGNFSTPYMNSYEYQTDQCAIAHGAGYQLLAWSEYVHGIFGDYISANPDSFWAGMMETERYMRPESIRKSMKAYGYPD